MPDSHSLRGMKQWTHKTDIVTRSKQIREGRRFGKGEIGDLAYHVYKTHAINNQIANVANGVRLRTPTDATATRIREEIKNNHPGMKWKAQGDFSSRGNYHSHTDGKRNMLAAQRVEAEQGLSARFSMTSDKFLDPTENAKGGTSNEYRRIANTVADWLMVPGASGSKVIQPKHLAKGRGDHAVLYGNIIDDPTRRQDLANSISSRMGSPSDSTPLGMDSVAKGVAYGEFVRSQKHQMPGQMESTIRPPGWGRHKESSSFGTNRAHIVAQAVQRGMLDPSKTLDTHLNKAITDHGYKADNPAYVQDSVKQEHRDRAATQKRLHSVLKAGLRAQRHKVTGGTGSW